MNTHTLKAWGLGAVIVAYFAALELKSALGAAAVNEGIAAYQAMALSIVCAIIAFVFARIAASYKFDVRPYARSAAKLARLVSVCAIIIPTVYLATANKRDAVNHRWDLYYGTEAHAADLALVRDPMADTFERQAARERIVKPSIEVDFTDDEFLIALALQVLGVLAAGVPFLAPATAAEVDHWRRVEAAQKGVATRKRNARAKAKAKQKPRLKLVS